MLFSLCFKVSHPFQGVMSWRHQMETFSALLAICAGNSLVTGEFPSQRPVTQSFDVFFDVCPNKRLSKQSYGLWFEMPSGSLWRHCNEFICCKFWWFFFNMLCIGIKLSKCVEKIRATDCLVFFLFNIKLSCCFTHQQVKKTHQTELTIHKKTR